MCKAARLAWTACGMSSSHSLIFPRYRTAAISRRPFFSSIAFNHRPNCTPIDFPQFTSTDSIDDWTIWRIGVRNRLLTRRDDLTVSWFELETFVDVNFSNPFDKTQYSNLFNRLRFTPLPWVTLLVDSQVPVFDKGFTEINTAVILQPWPTCS